MGWTRRINNSLNNPQSSVRESVRISKPNIEIQIGVFNKTIARCNDSQTRNITKARTTEYNNVYALLFLQVKFINSKKATQFTVCKALE